MSLSIISAGAFALVVEVVGDAYGPHTQSRLLLTLSAMDILQSRLEQEALQLGGGGDFHIPGGGGSFNEIRGRVEC